jgi:ribosome-associated translation inhibitor RaiA
MVRIPPVAGLNLRAEFIIPETQENRTMPLQIVFDHVQHSDAVEAAIRAKADQLAQFFARILGCRVTVGLLQKHAHRGKPFNIRIELTVPGVEIVVSRDQAEDIYVAAAAMQGTPS